MIKKKFNYRLLVQIFFFTLIAYYAMAKSLAEAGITLSWLVLPDISLHTLCPFGGVATLYSLLTAGELVRQIHFSAVVLAGIIVVLSIFLGPIFCGWVCPLGSVQDWISHVGHKIFKWRYNAMIPKKIDFSLRYARYLVLAWVIYVTAVTGQLIFSDYDPYYALFHFWTGEVAPIGLGILIVTSLLSLIIARPWCKYACPYGAVLGLFNKIKIFGLKRQVHTCISCNRCNKACPMNLDIAHANSVRDTQCISCMECTSDNSCPIPQTVVVVVGSVKKEGK
ncbi:MAG: 4Fe-4S binding protein [Eubacteriales bacterium]|nr:4Fe-4S binding protein [Eubacteriales bacterium]